MQSLKLPLFGKQTPSLAIWGCLSVALAISLAYSCHYLPILVDDALISYRYSERFLHGQGLTWTDGEFVEGYSNLLWVVLVAVGGLFQPNLIFVGWVLGLIANAAVLVAIVWTFARLPNESLLPVAGGLLTLSLSGAFAFWGVGGLETALVEALLAWALAIAYRMPDGRWGWACLGLLLGLLSITRPDGALFGVSLCAALVLRDGVSRATARHVAIVMLVPLGFVAAQIGFRLAYYGDFVPNTAYAKLAFTPERISLGSLYVGEGALVNSVPLAVILATVVSLWRSQQWQVLRQTLVFLVPGVVWLAYVGFIGGDVFPFHRHWMPALVCFAFAVSSLLAAFPRVQPRRFAIALAVASMLHLAFQKTVDPWFAQLGRTPEVERLLSMFKKIDPNTDTDPLRMLRRVTWRCIAVGEFLQEAFGGQQPLLAVDGAGCMPYASRLPSLDMLGLNDSHIAHHPPPDMGKGILGHELGDGVYVLSRKPDLIAFCSNGENGEPCVRSGREMVGMADFRRNYRLVYFRTGSVDAALWTRIEDGRLGIVRTADTVHIPGFLLATTPGVRGVLGESGKPAAALETGEAVVESIYLPVGTWDVSLETDVSSPLQLAPPSGTDSTVVRPNVMRIVSNGTGLSFRVFGGRGLIYGIAAKRLADYGRYSSRPSRK